MDTATMTRKTEITRDDIMDMAEYGAIRKERRRSMIEKKKLNQFGGMRGILTFDHQWLLEPVEGGTKVIQHEEYRGIGVWFWDYSWVEPAYTKANDALKKRVMETVE